MVNASNSKFNGLQRSGGMMGVIVVWRRLGAWDARPYGSLTTAWMGWGDDRSLPYGRVFRALNLRNVAL
ncbi:MAG: hypothetical protein RLZZ511_590 [Cyanobacteriota bacterium]